MLARAITSLQHPIVKKIIKLKEDSSFRLSEKLFVLTSDKIIAEANRTHPIKLLLHLAESPLAKQLSAAEKISVSKEVLLKCIGNVNQDTCVALFSLLTPLDDYRFPWLVFDSIQDPGNIGTLMRSGVAFNFPTLFFLDQCCDIYNDKVISAARGAHFHICCHALSSQELLALVDEKKGFVYYADTRGLPVEKMPGVPRVCLVLGNEGRGVSPKIKGYGQPLTIPMAEGVESLNVAVAGSIIMHEMRGYF